MKQPRKATHWQLHNLQLFGPVAAQDNAAKAAEDVKNTTATRAQTAADTASGLVRPTLLMSSCTYLRVCMRPALNAAPTLLALQLLGLLPQATILLPDHHTRMPGRQATPLHYAF